MNATLTNKSVSNLGNARTHYDVEICGEKIGQAGVSGDAFAKWSFMSLDGKTYKTFATKSALLAHAVEC